MNGNNMTCCKRPGTKGTQIWETYRSTKYQREKLSAIFRQKKSRTKKL